MKKYLLTLALVSIGFVVALIVGIGPQAIAQEETPDPIALERALVEAFPSTLFCEDVAELAPGPTWETLTIGESTLDDLIAYLATISTTAGVFPAGNNEFLVGNIFTDFAGQRGPFIIFGCTVGDIITVLQVWYITETLDDITTFTDLIFVYGEPDAVTYTNTQPSLTIMFWLDEGLAANVFTGASETNMEPAPDNPFYGRADVLTFFPYQDEIEGFEERWPYNRTYSFIEDAPAPIGTENPFDFESIQATVTGMPSPMPSPTFTPHAP